MTELERLAAGLRAAAAATRTVIAADGFTLLLAADGAHTHLSLTVPDAAPASGWAAALAALPAAFAAHGRSARVEAFAGLHPDVLAAADAAGWRRAMTAPVMTLKPSRLSPGFPCPGVYRELVDGDRAALDAALRGAHMAFGGSADDAEALAWRDQAERGLRTGAVRIGVVLAWLSAAEGALRLYQTLGFQRVCTQVNLEPP